MGGRSVVAGIVDARGGLRVVVTERWRLHHHVGPGETLFILPNVLVREPVSMGGGAALMERVKQHILSGAVGDKP